MEYRIVNYELDDDLTRAINDMAKRGWIMFKAFKPENWIDGDGQFIRIIWQREEKSPAIKTHKVLDLVYTPEEGQECFFGSLQECTDFIKNQGGGATFMYKIVPNFHK